MSRPWIFRPSDAPSVGDRAGHAEPSGEGPATLPCDSGRPPAVSRRNRTPGRWSGPRLAAILLAWPWALGLGTLEVASGPPALVLAATTQVDLNTAPIDELRTVLRIKHAEAVRIVRGRPYRSREELLSRKIISKATYERISGRIVVNR